MESSRSIGKKSEWFPINPTYMYLVTGIRIIIRIVIGIVRIWARTRQPKKACTIQRNLPTYTVDRPNYSGRTTARRCILSLLLRTYIHST